MASLRKLLILLCVMAAACAPKADPADQEKLQVANQMVEAWNTKNWEGVYELFAEDGVLHSVMKEPVVGRDAIRKRLKYIEDGVDRIELKITHMGIVDDVVFIERVDDFVFEGRHGLVPVVGVMEIADGQVSEWREYYDLATLEAAVKGE